MDTRFVLDKCLASLNAIASVTVFDENYDKVTNPLIEAIEGILAPTEKLCLDLEGSGKWVVKKKTKYIVEANVIEHYTIEVNATDEQDAWDKAYGHLLDDDVKYDCVTSEIISIDEKEE